MKVRYPNMDFSDLRAHWAENPEFAQGFNAFSTVPAHIEPYLIKVMNKAKKVLDSKYESLHNDIEIFNKQEVQHCRLHLAFNKQMYKIGYAEMEELEKPYKQDYEDFLNNRSLRFNVAYCEGFEALGSASAHMYFEDLVDMFGGADAEPVNLWKWHLAEEFEHRTVCYDLYTALYGDSLYSYLYRVWAFVYACKHIGAHTKKIKSYLIAKDRENMTPAELKESKRREKLVDKRIAKASFKRLKTVFSPFYDPGKKIPSPGMAEILAAYPDHR